MSKSDALSSREINRRRFLGAAGLSGLALSPFSPWARTKGYGDEMVGPACRAGPGSLEVPSGRRDLPDTPDPGPEGVILPQEEREPKEREKKGRPTRFLLACMTLPYHDFPLERALTGIKAAGFDYVAWGTTHKEEGKEVPVMAAEADPAAAKKLGKHCRDLGLKPV